MRLDGRLSLLRGERRETDCRNFVEFRSDRIGPKLTINDH